MTVENWILVLMRLLIVDVERLRAIHVMYDSSHTL
jgi:hypothetical protein